MSGAPDFEFLLFLTRHRTLICVWRPDRHLRLVLLLRLVRPAVRQTPTELDEVLRLPHHVEPDAWQVVNLGCAILTRRKDATCTVMVVLLLTMKKWGDRRGGVRILLRMIHLVHLLDLGDRINIRAAVYPLV